MCSSEQLGTAQRGLDRISQAMDFYGWETIRWQSGWMSVDNFYRILIKTLLTLLSTLVYLNQQERDCLAKKKATNRGIK